MIDPSRPDHNLNGGDGVSKTLSSAKAAALLSNWRLTPATMMAKLDPSWIPASWLQFLSLKIAATVAKGNCGLLISAPPRHGKSMLSTIATPLWVLENFPEKSVVVATYGEELSTDFTRQIRDIIQQNQASLNVRLRQDARRVTNILTTMGGGLKAVGLQGTITGRGADVLVIDDYIKNHKEAMSPAYLEDLWDWWRTVARTRLEPGAVVIILATRWVANDLHGRLMKQQKESGRTFFEYVEMPAIATSDNDILGRKTGEVLFPQRYNTQSILDIKAELGTRWFNAMFQQSPMDDEGRILDPAWFQNISVAEWDRRYSAMLADRTQKAGLTWMRGWDLASTKQAGDYTAGPLCLWNATAEEFYVRGMSRGQWSSARVEEEFVKASKMDAGNADRHGVAYKVGMEQEPGSSGAYTINHFRQLLRENEIPARLTEQRATTAKLLNAQPLLAAAENGKVFVVADREESGQLEQWARDLYGEMENFPEADHDDQIDGMSLTFKLLTGRSLLKPTFGRDRIPVPIKSSQSIEEISNSRIGLTFGRRLARVR